MLDKQGEFSPFGAEIGFDGEATVVAGDPGEGEHRASIDVLATFSRESRDERPDELAARVYSTSPTRVGLSLTLLVTRTDA